MNFLLYKAFYKKTLVASLLFLSLALGFFRCVGIEDLLPPTIGNFTLQANYNVTDTIFIDANLFDNFALGQVSIIIEPVVPNGNFSFNEVIKDNVGARLLKLERFPIVVIPANATLGEYKMTLTVTDVVNEKTSRAANKKIIDQNFMVGADNEDPSFDFPDNILPDINEVSQTPACQSQVLIVQGTATDNVGIKEIRGQLISENGNTVYLSIRETFTAPNEPDSVDLQTFFGNKLLISPNVPNGNLILKLTAIDTENNERSILDTILVNCDRLAPEIGEILTNRPISENNDNVTNVIQLQTLLIENATITDIDGRLSRVTVYFKKIGEQEEISLADIIFEVDAPSVTSTSLKMLFGDISVLIPPNVLDTDDYEIRVEVIDAAGNRTERIRFIDIKKNENPIVTDVILNNITSGNPIGTATLNNPLVVSPGFKFNLIGRITDDVALQSYEIVWRKQGADIITVIGGNVTGSFVSFSPVNNNIKFEIPQNARVGEIYTLTISATDTFVNNPTVSVTYYFRVQ